MTYSMLASRPSAMMHTTIAAWVRSSPSAPERQRESDAEVNHPCYESSEHVRWQCRLRYNSLTTAAR